MGSSFSAVYSRIFGKHEARIVMLGLDAAGKTTILYKLRLGEVETTIPTIGFNVESVEFSNRTKLVTFTAWDVGGRDKIRPLWRHYYKQANALIFVVDSNDRDRWEEAHDEMMRVLSEDECLDWPLLVFANKQDLPNSTNVEEITHKLKLHDLRNRNWYIQGSCATTGDGLYDGLDWLSKAIRPEDHGRSQETNHRQTVMPSKKTGKRRESKPEEAEKINVSAKQQPNLAQAPGSDSDTDVPESIGTEAAELDM